ncbi:MAG TPA: tetratricopeptide repeat protein [Pyrinomonadaceae bacterium]|nr:tetratricopeptide repeat protein [Pyrinomonadaceae bacterium]
MFILSGRIAARTLILNSVYTSLLLLLLLLVTASVARAQGAGTDSTGTGGLNAISGRIYFPSGRAADMRAKVSLETMTSSRLTVLADTDGAFRFKNLAAGSYTVVIEAGEDYETVREPVFIEGNSNLGRGVRIPMVPRTVMVPIYLRPKRAAAKAEAKPGVLDAALANVPKTALELYQKAQDAIQANDSKKAIEHLRAALSLYPEFALALNSLGVEYLKLGNADRALEALRDAVRLSPDAFVPRLNFGIAYLEKKQFGEAESNLRLALQKNDGSPSAHMYLGITLISLRRYEEAEKELERAVSLKGGESMAQAHKLLGGLYWQRGQFKQAAEQLEVYLKLAPKAPDAERIRTTVKELRSKG